MPWDGIYYGDYFYFANTNILDYNNTFSPETDGTVYPTLSVPNGAVGILQIRCTPAAALSPPAWTEGVVSTIAIGPVTASFAAEYQADYEFRVQVSGGGTYNYQSIYPPFITDSRIVQVDNLSRILLYYNILSKNVSLNVKIRTLGWIFQRNTFYTSVAAPETATWYVRASGSSGDGTSYAKAWNGFDSIDWSKISAGDTLYICGYFSSTLTVKSGTSSGSRITIRGDYYKESGVISVSSGHAIEAFGTSP